MIQKVAVIGGGPAGLCTIHEALKERPNDRGTIYVGFEAKSELGGVWSDTPGEALDEPTTFGQLAKMKDASDAADIRKIFYNNSPILGTDGSIQLRLLSGTSSNKPLKISRRTLLREGICFAQKTGLYNNFVSNAPQDLMNFEDNPIKRSNTSLYPLSDLPCIKKCLNSYVEKNKLDKSYRMNTSVEYVDRMGPAKYVLVLKKSDPSTNYDEWYLETFDAVVLASGHYLIPYIPFYMSTPKGSELAAQTIHEFNKKFPGILIHLRDIDGWYHRVLPQLPQKTKYHRIVIVGKSFSCMDLLKRIEHLQDLIPYEIMISTDHEPVPDERNPFKWFDEWLLNNSRVILKPQIKEFINGISSPQLKFVDDTQYEVDYVLFATGYLYSFPFVSAQLSESCRIFTTPDPRNVDMLPSNISRVTGLYLHTFSIAEPTLTFCGISSNATFQSFEISAKAIVGAFTQFNELFSEQKPKDFPHYDSIWKQILPPIKEQLMWSQSRLLQTGNSGAYHYYYPLDSLFQDWLKPCQDVFPPGDRVVFPNNWRQLRQDGFAKLQQMFLETMDPSSVG
ncbi:uncharacterized protein ZBAI_07142 [Zygosaccharomyces bailii ISA1307]|uniref:BN860_09912g1_1 n=1 Tax=Zygosaccharomyces bailii (strain CLIB 213 / ATCC 58445 / CBS 680 / BCRC 21525 / NBRC 1098 / NCYC 1416 / NRRL Y-2227) TaxID=1333698 RepID=A0A8J2X546_ZYGB2|nr:BN860_09912g1_1 [Zygosaccharomyces bailii CLIB 213]CDH15355.1 uncharacterized protein ZBAI_07142 [Zygosaccharomyces bailii ISA1307]